MIKKELIDLIVSRTKITKRDLIEKDLILHRLLVELGEEERFNENYAFKGGTCLTKCYLGYYRFSEDLDFTYLNQNEFSCKTSTQIRKVLSSKIDDLCNLFENISKKIGLDFKLGKKDLKYVQFGGSDRFVTFKLWYIPEMGQEKSFVKIQINFSENIFYPINKVPANNILFKKYKNVELKFILPEESDWLLKIPNLKCYNLKEIILEKVRAILTRKGVKGRDFLDVFLILNKSNINLYDLKEDIFEKIQFALKYEKYSLNLKNKSLDFIENFKIGDEQKLLIQDIPEGFYSFLKRFKLFLNDILIKLNNEQEIK